MYISQPLLDDPSTYFDYEGVVRLFIHFNPWRFVFHLKGVGMGKYGVLAELDRRDIDEDFTKEDLDRYLREGIHYTIQLEYHQAPLSFPVVQARLVDKDKTAAGLRLQFQFISGSEDLDLLLEELERRSKRQ